MQYPVQVWHYQPTRAYVVYLDDGEMIDMLKMLVKQANGFGAKLRVYKPKPKNTISSPTTKKYEYCISGQDPIGRTIKMGGTAEWLYNELLKNLTNYF